MVVHHTVLGTCQNDILELKLRAERRLGELIGETLRPGGDSEFRKSQHVTFDLPDGVTKMQSHRYQEAASVPEPSCDNRDD